MPYVSSKKTDGKSRDRLILDKAVDDAANEIIRRFRLEKKQRQSECLIIECLAAAFFQIGGNLKSILIGYKVNTHCPLGLLAKKISTIASYYEYDEAWMGELNYAITRLLQVIPRKLVRGSRWTSEFRYWIYAGFVGALIQASSFFSDLSGGDWRDLSLSGVFEDVKDEYKRRVNVAYEATQINKSGDCYDTPYYTRLVEVLDEEGNHFGFQEVMLRRTPETLNADIVGGFQLKYRKEEK